MSMVLPHAVVTRTEILVITDLAGMIIVMLLEFGYKLLPL
jgi:hypothetical protein